MSEVFLLNVARRTPMIRAGLSRRNYRKLGCLPGGEATRHLAHIGDSVLLQDADGDRGAVASGAVHRNPAVTGNFGKALLQPV